MTIKEFKKGDLIHRTAPIDDKKAYEQFSLYMGEAYELMGMTDNFIILKSNLDASYDGYGHYYLELLPVIYFDDEHWALFPSAEVEEFEQEIKEDNRKLDEIRKEKNKND